MSSRVLVVGANGFIGSHVARALEAAGHSVQRGMRPQMDLAHETRVEAWSARLADIDVLVNAAGVFRAGRGASLDSVHWSGPRALFEACAVRGVRVVHFSALGADSSAVTEFLRSKYRGDEALLALPVRSVVLQPSLVFGPGGASARLFTMLATLPLIPLPGRGGERVQPVAIEDVADSVVAIVARDHFPRARLVLAGPEAMTLRDFLARLRSAMGLGHPRFITLPGTLARAAARLRIGLLDRDSLAMLERGSVGNAAQMQALLGRAPRAVPRIDDAWSRAAMRAEGRLAWLLPVLRVSLALVWLAAAVVSAGLYPVDLSLGLLARTGLTGALAWIALSGAVVLDLAMGIATLVLRRRRWLWRAQMVLVLGYTAIITVFLPEQWLHPYGPVVKNAVILAALAILHELDAR
jgi:uncharacterized protein YbjT (DUF2867 family)